MTSWKGKPQEIRQMERKPTPDGGYVVRRKLARNLGVPIQR